VTFQVNGTFTPAPQVLVAAILNTLQYAFQVERGVCEVADELEAIRYA
jgi:hypothetical protein